VRGFHVASSLAAARTFIAPPTGSGEPPAFDLALVKLELPDGCGTTLVREIRDAGRIPIVIVFSANAEDESIVEGLAAGADDYLAKPVAAAVLRARIRAVQRRRSMRRSSFAVGSYCSLRVVCWRDRTAPPPSPAKRPISCKCC
jgi:DNA-binding response OmpR family regulator